MFLSGTLSALCVDWDALPDWDNGQKRTKNACPLLFGRETPTDIELIRRMLCVYKTDINRFHQTLSNFQPLSHSGEVWQGICYICIGVFKPDYIRQQNSSVWCNGRVMDKIDSNWRRAIDVSPVRASYMFWTCSKMSNRFAERQQKRNGITEW